MLPLVHERGFELLLEKILSQPTVRPFVTKRVRTPPATSLGKDLRNHLAHWFLTPFLLSTSPISFRIGRASINIGSHC